MSFISNQNIAIPSFIFKIDFNKIEFLPQNNIFKYVLEGLHFQVSRLPDEHFNYNLETSFHMKQGYCIERMKKIVHAFKEARIESNRKDLRFDIHWMLLNLDELSAGHFDPMIELFASAWKTKYNKWTALVNFISPSIDNLLDAVSKYSVKVDQVDFFFGDRSSMISMKNLEKVNNFLLEAQKIEVFQLDQQLQPSEINTSIEEYLRKNREYMENYEKIAESVASIDNKNMASLEFFGRKGSLTIEQSVFESPGETTMINETTKGSIDSSGPNIYKKKLSIAHLAYKLSPKSPLSELKPLAFLDRLSDWMVPLCNFLNLEVDFLVALCRCELQDQNQVVQDTGNMSFLGVKVKPRVQKTDSDDEDEEDLQEMVQVESSDEHVLVSPLYGVSCSKGESNHPQITIQKFLSIYFKNISLITYGETILDAFSAYSRDYANTFEEIDYRLSLEIIQLGLNFTLIGQSLYFEDWRNKVLKDQIPVEKSNSDVFSSQARFQENVTDIIFLPNKRIELRNVLVRQTDTSQNFDLIYCAINDFLRVFKYGESPGSPERTLDCNNVYLELYKKPNLSSTSFQNSRFEVLTEENLPSKDLQPMTDLSDSRMNEDNQSARFIRNSILDEKPYHRTVILLSKAKEVLDNETAYNEELKKYADKVKVKHLEPLKPHLRFTCTECDQIQIYALFFREAEADDKEEYFNCLSFLNIFKIGGRSQLELSDYGLTEVVRISEFQRLISDVDLASNRFEHKMPDHVLYSAETLTWTGTPEIIHFVSRLIFPDSCILNSVESFKPAAKAPPKYAGSNIQRKEERPHPDGKASKSQIFSSGEKLSQAISKEQLVSQSSDDEFIDVETSLFETRKHFAYQRFKRIFIFKELKIRLFPGKDFNLVKFGPDKVQRFDNLYSSHTVSSRGYSINPNVQASYSSAGTRQGIKLVQPVSFFKNARHPDYCEIFCERVLKEAFRSMDQQITQLGRYDIAKIRVQNDKGVILKMDTGASLTFETLANSAKIELELGFKSKIETCLLEAQEVTLLELLSSMTVERANHDGFSFSDGRLMVKVLLDYIFGQQTNHSQQTSTLKNVHPFSIENKPVLKSGSGITMNIPTMELNCNSPDFSLENFYSTEFLFLVKKENPNLANQLSLKAYHPMALTVFNSLLDFKSASTTKGKSFFGKIQNLFASKKPDSKDDYK